MKRNLIETIININILFDWAKKLLKHVNKEVDKKNIEIIISYWL